MGVGDYGLGVKGFRPDESAEFVRFQVTDELRTSILK